MQSTLDIFKGQWSSKLPDTFGKLEAGYAALFEDPRISWAVEQIGGVQNKKILELGPLEAGHTYMLENLGAASIVSVEANSNAYLKCLLIKELLELKRIQFLYGDFVEYLRNNQAKYDVGIASGVLYHMQNPVELIALLAKTADEVFLWTHFYDHDAIFQHRPKLAFKYPSYLEADYGGFKHTLYRYEYEAALQWEGFCGGSSPYSYWMTKDDILNALRFFGLTDIQIREDEQQALYDNPNGPSFSLVARRPSSTTNNLVLAS